MWKDLKAFVLGILSGILAFLTYLSFKRRGEVAENSERVREALNSVRERDAEIAELQERKDSLGEAKPTEEDSESFWNRKLK